LTNIITNTLAAAINSAQCDRCLGRMTMSDVGGKRRNQLVNV